MTPQLKNKRRADAPKKRNFTKYTFKLSRIISGFLTVKGELVRALLFPRKNKFRFADQTLTYIAIMLCVTAGGMAYTTALEVNASSCHRIKHSTSE